MFKEGDKVICINPISSYEYHPAIVTKTLNDFYDKMVVIYSDPKLPGITSLVFAKKYRLYSDLKEKFEEFYNKF